MRLLALAEEERVAGAKAVETLAAETAAAASAAAGKAA